MFSHTFLGGAGSGSGRGPVMKPALVKQLAMVCAEHLLQAFTVF